MVSNVWPFFFAPRLRDIEAICSKNCGEVPSPKEKNKGNKCQAADRNNGYPLSPLLGCLAINPVVFIYAFSEILNSTTVSLQSSVILVGTEVPGRCRVGGVRSIHRSSPALTPAEHQID